MRWRIERVVDCMRGERQIIPPEQNMTPISMQPGSISICSKRVSRKRCNEEWWLLLWLSVIQTDGILTGC
jgi:hypothetical protein